ncbi:MAG: putative tellurite resistance protein B-like protein [Paraglaciecola psychrophila]|jgi:uncharacterized tellurite resistance protein B-like protein
MSISNLSNIKKFFSGAKNADEQLTLYKEMLLMTLARATRADLVTDDIEVAIVQSILKDYTGEEFSSKDVRIAASSELYETATIDKFLGRVGPQIEVAQRQSIVKALVQVLGADGKVTPAEVDFFNMAVGALRLTPAETVGLVAP